MSMHALRISALALAFALSSQENVAAQGGAAAGAATGALTGGLLGGPVGAVIGGLAGAAVGSAAADDRAPAPGRVRAGARRPLPQMGFVERTCVRDRAGNQICQERRQ